MLQRNVRKSIADTILSRVLGGAVASTPAASAAESAAPPEVVPRSGATTPAEDIPVVYVRTSGTLGWKQPTNTTDCEREGPRERVQGHAASL